MSNAKRQSDSAASSSAKYPRIGAGTERAAIAVPNVALVADVLCVIFRHCRCRARLLTVARVSPPG